MDGWAWCVGRAVRRGWSQKGGGGAPMGHRMQSCEWCRYDCGACVVC